VQYSYFFRAIILWLFTVVLTASDINASPLDRSCQPSVYNLNQTNTTKQINEQNTLNQKQLPDSICIPVVIHNVYKLAEQKIDLQTVLQQIESINKDFNAQNNDLELVDDNFKPLIANVAFRFILVDKDLEGNDFDGINYKRSDIDTFKMNQHPNVKLPIKGIKAWKPNEYINIWVCNLEAGISGYASYPTPYFQDDGIVIHYQNFGVENQVAKPPFHLGRTLTHELGHYFGLQHLYGEELTDCSKDDGLADTPKTNRLYKGCPKLGENPNLCNDLYSKQDMVQNFMNHTNDGCMQMFTQNQKALMQYHLIQHRNGLLHKNCFTETTDLVLDASIQFINKPLILCDYFSSIQVNICNNGLIYIDSYEIKSNWNENIVEYLSIAPGKCMLRKLDFDPSYLKKEVIVSLENVNNSESEKELVNNSDTTHLEFLEKATFPMYESFETNTQRLYHTYNSNTLTLNNLNETIEAENVIKNGYCIFNNIGHNSVSQINYLHLPYFNLNEISNTNKSENLNLCLDFDYAYNSYPNSTGNANDGMIIEYSTTCAPKNYITLWEKWGRNLETKATSLSNNINFPNVIEDWETVHQNLNIIPSEGEELIFRIKFIANSSQSIFLDNLSFNFCESIPLNIQNYLTEHNVGVFPNPSLNGEFHLYCDNPKNLPIDVEVYDVSGLSIQSFQFKKHYPLNLSQFSNGCFFIKMYFESHILSKKLILSK